jgi:hypothetical protein
MSSQYHQTVPDLGIASRELFDQQLRDWTMLRDGVGGLGAVQTRSVALDGFTVRLQFNPARMASSNAKVDDKSIRERKCFLCPAQRPQQQRSLAFNDHYLVLCNPFPIFPEHFTIPHREHVPQRIREVFRDLLDLARAMRGRYTVFYNGPRCGASAPDHLHFQAGNRGFMTFEGEYDALKGEPIARTRLVTAYAPSSARPFLAIESTERDAALAAFEVVYRNLTNISPDPEEPMMNVVVWYDDGIADPGGRQGATAPGWRVVVFPRLKHRPSVYFAEGDARILLSPGTVDIGGVCILPVEKDYRTLTAGQLEQMFREVMLPPEPFARLRDAVGAVLR